MRLTPCSNIIFFTQIILCGRVVYNIICGSGIYPRLEKIFVYRKYFINDFSNEYNLIIQGAVLIHYRKFSFTHKFKL